MADQTWSVPAVGGGDVMVKRDRDAVLLFIDRGPGEDGIMAALEPMHALKLCQHILDAHEAGRV